MSRDLFSHRRRADRIPGRLEGVDCRGPPRPEAAAIVRNLLRNTSEQVVHLRVISSGWRVDRLSEPTRVTVQAIEERPKPGPVDLIASSACRPDVCQSGDRTASDGGCLQSKITASCGDKSMQHLDCGIGVAVFDPRNR